jgi:hypothetical protein
VFSLALYDRNLFATFQASIIDGQRSRWLWDIVLWILMLWDCFDSAIG